MIFANLVACIPCAQMYKQRYLGLMPWQETTCGETTGLDHNFCSMIMFLKYRFMPSLLTSLLIIHCTTWIWQNTDRKKKRILSTLELVLVKLHYNAVISH
ncbi:hypothetical protein CY35_07G107000 [Sphagnum magellanicum]|uniref:Uncharacterized protein n=1 Tax=Sphagnum magellanicum TaxID=128215 RepID=A0ACB8HNP9_9BRYO|nr:hypothetical protein CY35_07G107000 [Sphagnum magellanicum]